MTPATARLGAGSRHLVSMVLLLGG
jgi:hypothetical protein